VYLHHDVITRRVWRPSQCYNMWTSDGLCYRGRRYDSTDVYIAVVYGHYNNIVVIIYDHIGVPVNHQWQLLLSVRWRFPSPTFPITVCHIIISIIYLADRGCPSSGRRRELHDNGFSKVAKLNKRYAIKGRSSSLSYLRIMCHFLERNKLSI